MEFEVKFHLEFHISSQILQNCCDNKSTNNIERKPKTVLWQFKKNKKCFAGSGVCSKYSTAKLNDLSS